MTHRVPLLVTWALVLVGLLSVSARQASAQPASAGSSSPSSPSSPASPADVVVAEDGDDDGPGTAEEPFATLERARRAVRALVEKGLTRDVSVLLRGGTYRIERPLTFAPGDGGTEEHSVTWSAWPGETPVVSGGRVITGWNSTESGWLEAKVPEVASGDWTFRELFVNGQRRPRARHPNDGYLRIEEAGPDNRTSFTYREGDLRAWPDVEDAELVFLHDWSTSRVPIASIDESTRTVKLAAPVGPNARHYAMTWFEPTPRYFLEGSEAFLDAPGEWHLDEERGALRYLPVEGETLRSVEAIAPVAEELLVVRGTRFDPVRNLHFEGILFQHAAWSLPEGGYAAGQAGYHERRGPGEGGTLREPMPAAIVFERAEGCSVEDCMVSHIGRSAIHLGARTRGCRIVGTVIGVVAGNGVMIGEDRTRPVEGAPWWQSAPHQVASGNTVEGCRISRCGDVFFGCVGVWVGIAEKTRIARNHIRLLPYTGVSLGWMWSPTPTPCRENVVEKNHIHSVMQTLSDGAGIYTLGLQPGTVLRENHIHDVSVNLGRAESNGMFIDEGSTGLLIEGNIIWDIARSPLRFHRATKNVVRGNLLYVKSEDVPAFRYNSTEPDDIEKADNEVGTGRPSAEVLERAWKMTGLP